MGLAKVDFVWQSPNANELEDTTIEELLKAYPQLTKEDVLAAISYSADVISHEELIAS